MARFFMFLVPIFIAIFTFFYPSFDDFVRSNQSSIEKVKDSPVENYESATWNSLLKSSFDRQKWSSGTNKLSEEYVLFTGTISAELHSYALKKWEEEVKSRSMDWTREQKIDFLFKESIQRNYGVLFPALERGEIDGTAIPYYKALQEELHCNGLVWKYKPIMVWGFYELPDSGPEITCPNNQTRELFITRSADEMFANYWKAGGNLKILWVKNRANDNYELVTIDSDVQGVPVAAPKVFLGALFEASLD